MQAASRQLTFYLDGAVVLRGRLRARTAAGNAGPLSFGRAGAAGGYWRGKLDDVRLWSVARSAGEIAAGYRAQLADSPPGLVGNWRFDEGSGATAADPAGSPQNASLKGNASWSTDVHP
jgi:hypothetical protein